MCRKWIIGCFLSLLLCFLCVPLRAQESRVTFSLFGGLNNVREYGSGDDYVLGEDDFPVTPSHTPVVFGVALGFDLVRGFGLEADLRYHLGSSLTLEDPSDGDTISIDSSKHFTLTGNLYYRFSFGKIRPYILVGAGIDTLSGVREQALTSGLGYEITLLPPDDTSDMVINAGSGCLFLLNQRMGLRLDVRYVHILRSDELPAINSFNTVVGLILYL